MRHLFERLSIALCALAALAAAAAMSGYLAGNALPVALRAGFQGMSPLTALAIISLAAGVVSTITGSDLRARRFATAAALLGGAGLVSHALAGADVLSGIVARGLAGARTPASGSMSIATGLCVCLLALACIHRRRRPSLSDGFSAAAAFVAGTALLGYAYGVDDLYRLPMFNTMALNTAACLFSLAAAVMAAVPSSGAAEVLSSRGWSDHAFTRRLVGFVCVVPLAGWALVMATRTSRVGLGAAMALLVVVTVAPLAWLILRDGRLRMALEAERRERARLQESLNARLEVTLAQKVLELEREVAERAKAEQAMHRSQRMEAVGRLTGGIAHDFNNLLQALSGNVTLLQRRLSDTDPLRKFADNAAKAVQKGAKLTGQLLAFSRTQRLTIKPVFARAAMQDACELARASLGPDITLQPTMPADTMWVSADAQQLELALVNLMINARDAMPEGGLIRVFSRPAAPPVGAEAAAGFLAICVADDGEGMPPEVASRAGEPFFTTKPQGKGTGLGLAQVFGFARQCGGEVRIDSRVGAGTTVEIVLPLAPAGAPEQHALALASTGRPTTGRRGDIVVIDDDDSVRAVIVQGLADVGFVVREASDGLAGLALMEALAPALAVIDFMMPTMNGAEVARRLRTRWPALPIVFVSGYSETLVLDGIAGATVLRKPFDLDGLRTVVERALADAGDRERLS